MQSPLDASLSEIRMHKRLFFWAAACLSLPVHAAPDLARAMAGAWSGTLQYRDYGNDRQVILPTTVTFSGTSAALRGDYVYDDGPGKTVRSTERWALAADGSTLTLEPAGKPARVTAYRGAGEADLALEAEGTGEENRHAVAVRTQVARDGDALTITRLTQLPGQAWLVRHTYRLSKVQ